MTFDQYKIIFVGDGKVGKSSFVNELYSREIDRYVPTLGLEVHSYTFPNEGAIFNIWDTSGREDFGGLQDGYYIQGECFIVFCSLDNIKSILNIPDWILRVRRVCENAPFILLLNKNCENQENLQLWENMKEVYPDAQTYEFSIKDASRETLEEPLQYFIEKLRE